MGWFSWGGTSNEMGEYLPDDEATLQEGSEIIEAKNKESAREECKDVASQYDAVSSDVEETDQDNTWNCKFKFWG
ncbi:MULTISPECIES: hypothetical protein [unclassified Tolypothrix]|uniref:hypothetical protein n=1 Tax=unclassified Tolypothrix TaxID=2649714 RepID=UPI0005EAB7C5|nr:MULTISPECIES: hypothetical protein [unclassified Tolypothrix]BAY94383.1 hypothetical protein NIES3275_64310 [Microchaete diplosiphon NIES-3275]EKF04024.1 hypothetical protein FDUTEX481_02849 [Tolypothrix sp. PCC 7601]MBE9085721.1 hypothetical protein [Tolypothrix sp. LEGE 11397]UYD28105.1 hypothetical protein HGR01_08730 [Tolypothrix sp. PCC 7712]UYD36024.1 hypothetical protein HG267_09895 [Tolypothrix sp. PCC 7601]